MPTRGELPPLMLDTSAAVALVLADHEHHDATLAALDGAELGLAGHAAFETFSVLTRLPPPARLSATVAARVLAANFPHTRFLNAQRQDDLLRRLASLRIAGGAVYDALVGAAAMEHGRTLVTRDVRAITTYRALGVPLQVL